MNITCPCKDRPRVTAGATVPGASAALNVEEVRGEDLVAGVGLISTPCRQCDSVLPSAAASQQSLEEGSTGIHRVLLRFFQGKVMHGVTTGLCPVLCSHFPFPSPQTYY